MQRQLLQFQFQLQLQLQLGLQFQHVDELVLHEVPRTARSDTAEGRHSWRRRWRRERNPARATDRIGGLIVPDGHEGLRRIRRLPLWGGRLSRYKLTGVTRDYRRGRQKVHALQGIDLAIEDGDWLAIQGPTGHGKSTLLQILGGLDRPTAGSVELAGHDLTRLRESQLTKVRATSIGFIFQTFNLIPTLSAQ
jgi:ABC-type protease/lipase transport system fused ATPase/permease subunit